MKRTRVLVGVAAGVVVLLFLAGALLLRPVPYKFLRGAHFDGVSIESELSLMLKGSTSSPNAYRTYRLDRRLEDVCDEAGKELSRDGKSGRLLLEIGYGPTVKSPGLPSANVTVRSEGGCTVVTVATQATFTDRAEAWLWKLTHR